MQDSLVDGPLFVLQSRQFAGQRQYAPIVSGTFTGSWVRTLGSRWTNEAKVGVNRVHLVLNQTDPNVGRDQLDANRSYPCTTINGVDIQLGCLQDIDRTNLGLEFIDNIVVVRGRAQRQVRIQFPAPLGESVPGRLPERDLQLARRFRRQPDLPGDGRNRRWPGADLRLAVRRLCPGQLARDQPDDAQHRACATSSRPSSRRRTTCRAASISPRSN